MAKESFYFSHDYGARNDPKLQKVRIKLGHEGKSIYWDLIEMIYEEGGKLLINEIDTYADTLRTTPQCIKALINDFGLFNKNKINFWSESANGRLEQRNIKSEKARKSAMNRWEKDANALKEDANALRIDSERNAKKEIKVKEIKERKEAFKNALTDFISSYDKDLLNAFYKYWTEPNPSKTKMKFELEKTWDTGLRLSNWKKRGNDKFDSKNQKPELFIISNNKIDHR